MTGSERKAKRGPWPWCLAAFPGWDKCPALGECDFTDCRYPERAVEFSGERFLYSAARDRDAGWYMEEDGRSGKEVEPAEPAE